ncbi:MAG: aminotransferase class IV [Aminipila sp.]
MIEIDAGYYYGIGAFETIAVKNGAALLLNEHLQRLNHTLEYLKISQMITAGTVMKFLNKENPINGVLKIMVSEKNVKFSTRENPYTKQMYDKGFSLCMCPFLRNETSPLTYHKTLNYAENIIAKQTAQHNNMSEALFINTKGEVSECSSSNIFFVKGKKLYTPLKECGILPGIFRNLICTNEKVEETKIRITDLHEFEECFITNSIVGIMKVVSIEKDLFCTDELTSKLQDKYKVFF